VTPDDVKRLFLAVLRAPGGEQDVSAQRRRRGDVADAAGDPRSHAGAAMRRWKWHCARFSNVPHSGRTPVRCNPGFDFSITGLVYCATTMLMGVAAINGQINLLFGVFGLMSGVLLVSGFICRNVLMKLRLTRQLPEQFVVGRPATLTYEFKNYKRIWPSLSVTMLEQEGTEAFVSQPTAYLLHAAAGMTAKVDVQVMPKRRGRHVMGTYQLSTSFPFGFIKRSVTRSERDVALVCPALGEASNQLLGLCRCDQRTDAPFRPRRGGQDEFYGVKEHRVGENPRWIYWRRSARTPGVLVSKEMTQVAPPRLLLLVDTHLQQADIAEQAAIEKALAMAATLASQTLDNGLAVGLCAWGGEDWLSVPIQQGKRQRREVLTVLAGLPRNTTAEPAELLREASALIKGDTTAVLFTPREMQVSLTDRLRGALVVVPSVSPWVTTWFKFDPGIDFARCIPLDENPAPKRGAKTRGAAESRLVGTAG
jgi:uncharacterized protein (DUF58 family)